MRCEENKGGGPALGKGRIGCCFRLRDLEEVFFSTTTANRLDEKCRGCSSSEYGGVQNECSGDVRCNGWSRPLLLLSLFFPLCC